MPRPRTPTQGSVGRVLLLVLSSFIGGCSEGEETCDHISDRIFLSEDKEDCGDTSCLYRLTFYSDGEYSWERGSEIEVGSYSCKGNDILLDGAPRGSYGGSENAVVFDGIVYLYDDPATEE